MTPSGASATSGDVVRNDTTGEVGVVVAGKADGRVLVASSAGVPPIYAWERPEITVIGRV